MRCVAVRCSPAVRDASAAGAAAFAQHHGDLAVGLDGGALHFVQVQAAAGTQSGGEVLRGQQFPAHEEPVHPAVVHQGLGAAVHQVGEPREAEGGPGQHHVAADERGCRDEPADERVVACIHGVLHRIRQDEQQHEVERRELTCLALAREPQERQQECIHHHPAQDEFPPWHAQSPHRRSPGNEGGRHACRPDRECAIGRGLAGICKNACPFPC